jgi:SAM-dependent methyltransferase
MNVADMYIDGEYLKHNPTWDVEDAPWKADLIFRMLQKHRLEPKTICEVGCGSGEILHHLQQRMPVSCEFTGYEISPQAYELCKQRTNERLCFLLKNFSDDDDTSWDLILLIDLIEHLEDYFQFLREIKGKSQYKILHIPIEMFALSALYPQFLLGQRKKVGHLHYFSKETALQMLRDLGFEIIDYSYTAGYALPRDYGLKDKLLKIPRWLFFPASNDLTVRVFGGYSLLVLVK